MCKQTDHVLTRLNKRVQLLQKKDRYKERSCLYMVVTSMFATIAEHRSIDWNEALRILLVLEEVPQRLYAVAEAQDANAANLDTLRTVLHDQQREQPGNSYVLDALKKAIAQLEDPERCVTIPFLSGLHLVAGTLQFFAEDQQLMEPIVAKKRKKHEKKEKRKKQDKKKHKSKH
jgi:hypothetical protein